MIRLIFDCRSYSAAYKLKALMAGSHVCYEEVIVIYPRSLNRVMLTTIFDNGAWFKYRPLPVMADDRSCLRYGYSRLKTALAQSISDAYQFDIITSFPRGILYTLLTSYKKKIKNCKIFVLDDGFSNSLSESYIEPDSLFVRTKFFFTRILCFTRDQLTFGFFDLQLVDSIFTVYPEALPKDYSGLIIDPSRYYSKWYPQMLSQASIDSSSILFLGHHAAESGRLKRHHYHDLVKRLVSSWLDQDKKVYFSSHHAESSENKLFYKTIGMSGDFDNEPAELLIATGQFSIIIAPLNTTLIECDKIQILSSVSKYIGYKIPGSYKIDERYCLTKLICKRNDIHFSCVE